MSDAQTQETSEVPVEVPFESSKLFRFTIGMFCEKRVNGLPQFSIGRFMLGACFLINCYFWLWLSKPAPALLGNLTLALAGNVIGSKTIDTAKSIAGTVAGAVSTWRTTPPKSLSK